MCRYSNSWGRMEFIKDQHFILSGLAFSSPHNEWLCGLVKRPCKKKNVHGKIGLWHDWPHRRRPDLAVLKTTHGITNP